MTASSPSQQPHPPIRGEQPRPQISRYITKCFLETVHYQAAIHGRLRQASKNILPTGQEVVAYSGEDKE